MHIRDGQVKSIFDLNQVKSSHKSLDLTWLGIFLKRKWLDLTWFDSSQKMTWLDLTFYIWSSHKSSPKLYIHTGVLCTSVLISRSKLATKYLCIPATSAAVERIFSQIGFIFRSHRARMSRKTLQQLTLLKCNSEI